MEAITISDFTTTLLVDQTPKEAFRAINNVRGWWSEEIDGSTDKLDDEFVYHYEDVHYCRLKLIEVIPDEKIVWLVLDNYFNFTKDKTEWRDTKISFEIAKRGSKTQIRFTHLGLIPTYECFDVCSNAWSRYVQQSLLNLITTGKGQPNPKEGRKRAALDFTTTLLVDQTQQDAFRAINDVRGWWSTHFEGHSEKLNDIFTVHFSETFIKAKIIELVPDQKIVWHVIDCNKPWLKNKKEWKDTTMSWEIFRKDKKTLIRFTHLGLVPEIECFEVCSNAWGQYIQQSLRNLITTGKGQPTLDKSKAGA